MSQISTTVYLEKHKAMNAQLVDFAGFLMPMQYSGMKNEHLAVRNAAGLFDVSHMGEILFAGEGAAAALDHMVSNDVLSLPVNHALYTPIMNPQGGIVDDCIIYRRGEEDLLVVVNASNAQKDFAWFTEHSPTVVPQEISDQVALLALQGPKAAQILALATGATDLDTIPSFGLGYVHFFGEPVMIARTGYTGEDGFEIFLPPSIGPKAWDLLFEVGEAHGLVPAGLGARDTLRLEAKLWLYGNDIDDTTTPLEAGMGFAVKLDAGEFIGKEVLLRQKAAKPERRLIGFKVLGKGIPRHGYAVYLKTKEGKAGPKIGEVTSGTKVPFLKESVGMAYVPRLYSKSGRELFVEIRDKMVPVVIVRGPFYKRS